MNSDRDREMERKGERKKRNFNACSYKFTNGKNIIDRTKIN